MPLSHRKLSVTIDTEELGGGCSIAIVNLSDSDSHAWKQKIDLILTFIEADHVKSESYTLRKSTPEYIKWIQSDTLATVIIRLFTTDDMLEHIKDVASAKLTYENNCNVLQRLTLLNKLRAQQDFYTVKMRFGEKMLLNIIRV